jgi:hypothetical protein
MYRHPLREIRIQFHESLVQRSTATLLALGVESRLEAYRRRTASAMRVTISSNMAGGVAKFSRANPG